LLQQSIHLIHSDNTVLICPHNIHHTRLRIIREQHAFTKRGAGKMGSRTVVFVELPADSIHKYFELPPAPVEGPLPTVLVARETALTPVAFHPHMPNSKVQSARVLTQCALA